MNDGAAILAGDIGGTNARFALVRVTDGRAVVTDVWKRPGADFSTFEDALAAYRAIAPEPIVGAAFGAAGAVNHNRTRLLNGAWKVDGDSAARLLGVSRAIVVNDFMAMARSVPTLDPAPSAGQVRDIASGDAVPEGSIAVGGPGTGFGVAALRRMRPAPGVAAASAAGWIVIDGEGGHQAFSPQTEFEWQVAARLKAELGYVSNEMVAAGIGFGPVLRAVAAVMGASPRDLSPADIEALALQGDPLSLAMCRLRARTVMTAMGDLALQSNATGGVFIAGGVGVRLETYLKEPETLARFYARGPRTELLSRIPIRLVVAEEAPLVGAAHLWRDEQARGWL